MSIIKLEQYTVEDFVSIDCGMGKVKLTIFNGRVQVGTPAWANELTLTPEKARMIGERLLHAALEAEET